MHKANDAQSKAMQSQILEVFACMVLKLERAINEQ